MSKLRLAFVSTHPPGTGSLNEYGFHMLRYLRQKPELDEIILLADELPGGVDYEFPADEALAPVSVEPCWRFDDLLTPWRLLRAVRRARPDVVLFNIQFASFGSRKVPAALGLLVPALLRAIGVPTVVLLHNIMETVDLENAGFSNNRVLELLLRGFGTLATRALLRADLVAVTIPKYVELLEQKYGASNVILAPHGSFEEPGGEPELELPDGPLQIMTFGKFGTYKKVEPLIEAVVRLRERPVPPLEVVIAGSDSPNAPGYLESVRERYRDVPGLRFTGYVPEEEVSRTFNEAAVVVFPYTSTTGSSGVLHQAGDHARAVVLPRLGDLAELIEEEGYAGEFFEPGDSASLADAIGRLIDDPDYRREMGRRNFLAARGLPMSDVVDWYLLHIQSMLPGATPAAGHAEPTPPRIDMTKQRS